jgi:hypothetical protein
LPGNQAAYGELAMDGLGLALERPAINTWRHLEDLKTQIRRKQKRVIKQYKRIVDLGKSSSNVDGP